MPLEPQKNWQKEVKAKERERIGNMNALALATMTDVLRDTVSRLQSIFGGNQAQYNKIERNLVLKYGDMFKEFKKDIVEAYNESGIEQMYLVSQTLGRVPNYAFPKPVKRLPTGEAFRITNKVLSEKSVLKRNRLLSLRVSSIIKSSVNKGLSIPETTKKLEVEFGFRDRRGRKMTKRSKDLLKKGLFSHTNGHFYMAYRIARTESMRMVSIQSNDVFDDLASREEGVRLKMVSVIDSRTRMQSVDMNGQLSRKDGKFKYPNGFYYRHGEAPARWSINDRETTITVFLNADRGEVKYDSLQDFKTDN